MIALIFCLIIIIYNISKREVEYKKENVLISNFTLNISKFTDMCLYVFRAHVFEKNSTVISNKIFTENKFNKMYSILNGVDTLNKSYGYGYGYGYGNSYGYGDENKKKSKSTFKPWTKDFWKNLFK